MPCLEYERTLQIQLGKLQSSKAAITTQLEQANAAKDEMEAALQQLQEECNNLKQEHQKTLEELNSVKVCMTRVAEMLLYYTSVSCAGHILYCCGRGNMKGKWKH